jgi:adenylate cyclase
VTQEGFKRKLTAILSADAVGYSRLMREDEETTVRDIAAHRFLITEIIQQHHCRVIDSPGDNVFAEFASVVDAVNGAIKIQREIKKNNTDTPKERRMEFRIGINLGDVIEEEDRIYGDGVNIAARVEGLALAGGIAISGTVYEHIRDKLSLGYHYLGEQNVKNIPEPIRIYRLLTGPEATGKMIGEKMPKARQLRRSVFGFLSLIMIVAGAAGVWYYYYRPSFVPASIEKMAFPLPEKPSIAVLPFTNMSGDPGQEYFSDGITEDLITDLSKISGLFVIARNSTFNYKGKSIKPSQIAEELGVRYILDGSVRRYENQVRINAQLIDTLTGGYLWAERYDGKMVNVLKLQDTVNEKIVTALAVKLTVSDKNRFLSKDTINVEAYDIFLKGMAHYRKGTIDNIKLAISYFERAIDLDPNYSQAYAALAAVYMMVYKLGGESLLTGIKEYKPRLRAEELIQVSMKNPTPLSYQVAAAIYIEKRMHEIAIDYANQAIVLDPNDPESYYALAMSLAWSGKAEESLKYINIAMRLDPYYPPYYLFVLGLAYFIDERYEEAAGSFERLLNRNPDHTLVMPFLVACNSYLKRVSKAKAMLERYSKRYTLDPIFLLGAAQIYSPFKEDIDLKRLATGFQMAMED